MQDIDRRFCRFASIILKRDRSAGPVKGGRNGDVGALGSPGSYEIPAEAAVAVLDRRDLSLHFLGERGEVDSLSKNVRSAAMTTPISVPMKARQAKGAMAIRWGDKADCHRT